MATLVWDKVSDKNYGAGIDRGVLYLPDGSAVPWNGLTSVVENFEIDNTPIYYDGMKISDSVTLGNFNGTLKALTYPNEFIEIEGNQSLTSGFIASNQQPKTFNLCYRTKIFSESSSGLIGYKIHILYNVSAVPSARTYETLSTSVGNLEFEWTITTVPEDIPGMRPTSHFIISSIDAPTALLTYLETMLYGNSTTDAMLLSMTDLVNYISTYQSTNNTNHITITDNGDGTWTATTSQTGLISVDANGLFKILKADADYLDSNSYSISSI